MGARSRDRERALEDLSRAVRVLTGREASEQAQEQFVRYLDLLVLWGRAQRLTGFQSPAEIVRGLFIDSLLFLPLLPLRPIRVVDIGAGAGFPGVPLAIVDPGIALTLVEAKRKRVSFLKAVRRDLHLEARVAITEGRAEHVCADLTRPGLFDAAVARAAGPIEQLVPTALAYLKPGGIFIAAGPPTGPDRPGGSEGDTYQWQVLEYKPLGLRRGFWVATRSR